MQEITEITISGQKIVLDPAKLAFNEITLSKFLEEEGGWYNYFGQRLAEAEYVMQRQELEYEVLYSNKFKEFKDLGASDKLAESKAKADLAVKESKVAALEAKYKVRALQQHLRAWDKAHENAQSRGHFLRKEMDKLNRDIMNQVDNYFEKKLEEIAIDPDDIKAVFQ